MTSTVYSQKAISFRGSRPPGFGSITKKSIEHHSTDSQNPQFYTHFPEYDHTNLKGFNNFMDSLSGYAEALTRKFNCPVDGYPIITIHANTLVSLDNKHEYFIFDADKAQKFLKLACSNPCIRFSFENIPFEHDLYTGARYCEEAYDPLGFLSSMSGVHDDVLPNNIGITFDTTHWLLGQLKLGISQ